MNAPPHLTALSSSSINENTQSHKKDEDPVQPSEVRFAVVMYGGVSLAIYMNGVAQELLKLVRSTAESNYNHLQNSERVYRTVSYLRAGKTLKEAEEMIKNGKPIPTRFIIDVISGSSAGGINGIFLSKALANGQDMTSLAKLWVQEGDIAVLINDKKSVERPLSVQKPPESLLNSRRMYLKLLNAFDEMDHKKNGKIPPGPKHQPPLVDQLDLFVTATDILGITLPLRLADKVVYERRYRNVFHFIHSPKEISGETEDRNDFHHGNNPFLAFAARSTSAFPFAFEPMRLCDVDEILEKHPNYYQDTNSRSDNKDWKKFYRDYAENEEVLSVPFPHRSFGDGGYLDNKPFSYAVDMLVGRQADIPVDRKLIYIEPSPEHPEEERESDRKPNAVENTLAALLKLPQKETIRGDLEKVQERNRIIDRVKRILKGVDQDIDQVKIHTKADRSRGALHLHRDEKEQWAKPTLKDEEWAKLDLTDMIKRKGQAYMAYHRLEIEAVTDELANLVTRINGLDVESDYFLIIWSLIRAWRKQTYVEYAEGGKPTLNEFLHTFNLAYQIRRLSFLLTQIDRLYRLDDEACKMIEFRVGPIRPLESADPQKWNEAFQNELFRLKKIINNAYLSLIKTRRLVRSQQASLEGIQKIKEEIIQAIRRDGKKGEAPSLLDYFLGSSLAWEEGKAEDRKTELKKKFCETRAEQILMEHALIYQSFNTMRAALSGILKPAMAKANHSCRRAWAPIPEDEISGPGAVSARTCIQYYYENYDDYDMVIFPILYGTAIGEMDEVEIIRISPEDATVLIDEQGSCCRKLAGTSLMHFGAFLKDLWRKNDILWGRLDGAERLITALIPGHPQLRTMIGEAQAAIVWETIRELGPDQMKELLVESLMRPGTPEGKARAPETLRQFLKELKNHVMDTEIKRGLESRINELEISDHYQAVFETQSRLEPRPTLESAARATTVIGDMLSHISGESSLSKKYIGWISRLGRIFWGLIEVAVPRSIPNLLFRHWIKLLYLTELVMAALGTVLIDTRIQKFSLSAFGLTLAVHLTVLILQDYLRFKTRWINIIKVSVGFIFVLLIALGITSFLALSGIVEPIWNYYEKIRSWCAGDWLTTGRALGAIGLLFIVFLLGNVWDALGLRIRSFRQRWFPRF